MSQQDERLSDLRIGFGYDSHRLEKGRPLLLGGVEVPAPVGADAHSDGDVVLHALVDGLLGAIGAGDIGTHFPDSDPRWAGQSSRLFLEHAARLVAEAGYRLINADVTIILERVRLGEWKGRIADSVRSILSARWRLPSSAVSIKAKTNERCDAVGEGRAIVAHAAVLLVRGGDRPDGDRPDGDPESPQDPVM